MIGKLLIDFTFIIIFLKYSSKSLPNKGCKGGNPLMAFMDSRGIPYEEDYPYLESAGQCRTGFKTDVSLFGGYEALVNNILIFIIF